MASEFTPSCMTSPICPTPHATMGRPMPMYSNNFVGEPKNSVPSTFCTWGGTSTAPEGRDNGGLAAGTDPGGQQQHAPGGKIRGAFVWGTAPGERTGVADAVILKNARCFCRPTCRMS